jgi:non-specific serine/threonine protein kinase/serine/threonine-protein kinase
MTREEWLRVKAVAAAAWEQPPDSRAAYLSAVCAGDGQLREEVDRLLESADAASSMFETPAFAAVDVAAVFDPFGPSQPLIGSRVGAFRIERELGRGGMGGVYLAERVDGEFDHRVAIKFVGNAASRLLLERFREERRILAGLNHPNIARLLDGGTTSSGIPYVVMEYVDGVAVDEYCARHQLGLEPRIELFREICTAVQYAHQRLVVHRDIKPSNILVTPAGVPKLLDFGIAKIVESRDEAVTALRPMTLASASPEQIRGEPITIATDVYALGVLLYGLVAGRSPYGPGPFTEHELVRKICDDEPDAPGLDRELDLIVLKALRKEPARRYGSVEQLAEDLGRYLDGRPVLAAPDSASYRARKFVARHKASVAVAAAALVAVIAGAGIAVWQAGVASRERLRAEERLSDVRRLAGAFIFDFHDAITNLPGALPARKLVASRAAEYLDRLARESNDDVSLQRDLAAAYQRLGDILGGGGASNLGDLAGAARHYENSLRIRERLARRADAEAMDLEGVAQLNVLLSRSVGSRNDLARAEEYARAAVATLELPLAAASTRPNRRGELATAYHQLGFIQARRGQEAPALQSLERAHAYAREQVAATPADDRELARLARIQADYAEQLNYAGRAAESVGVLHDARTSVEQLLARDPHNVRYQQHLQVILNNQGDSLTATGDARGAVGAYAQALAVVERLRDASPEDQSAYVGAVMARYSLAMGLVRAGDVVEGVAQLRRAIADGKALLQRVPDLAFTLNQVASATLQLGDTLFRLNPHDPEACRQIEAGLTMFNDLRARGRLSGETAVFQPKYEAMLERCAEGR